MSDELSWHVGKDDSNGSLDRPPFKAYFYRRSNGKVMRSAEYTKVELVSEIARLRGEGKDVSAFEAALKQL
jgi:hypothetical protein